ncbi:MAG: DUF2975 domain-containing protein [Clostridiaceae bacterium]|nr:DUF2975 domain-containing protein [Clostridiaceae bacterium]MBW4860576.1 DUF2975 domain-containing protein [Clostridiaceae bacterium]MBW4868492.1 DUF2975 domain-containing protein [Clostridiaceae bacterium]
MKNDNRLSFLKGILNLILLGTILSFVGIISYALVEGNGRKIDTILRIVMGLIFSGGYFVIVFTLKKILESIRKKDPFNRDNTVYFKRIGYYIFIVGVMDAIMNYPNPNHSGLQIISTSYGSLKPIFFLYLVLSILSFILSDVFRMAMEIKDENDLTV